MTALWADCPCPFSPEALKCILMDCNRRFTGCGVKVLTKKELENSYSEIYLDKFIVQSIEKYGAMFRQILRDKNPDNWTIKSTQKLNTLALVAELMENYWDDVIRVVRDLDDVIAVNVKDNAICGADTVLIKTYNH